MSEDVKSAAPSTAQLDTAQDAALASNDYASYAAVENARDLKTALPEAPPPSKETAVTPASETGTDKSIQEKKPKTGEDRKAELHAEIQELLRKRDELKGKTETPVEKKAEPAPATVTPPAAKAPEAAKPGEAPQGPDLDDFATYKEYQAADRKYVRDLVTFEAKQLLTEHANTRVAAEAERVLSEAWDQKIAAGKEEHADFAEVAFSKDTPITPVMDGFIRENGPRILYELGKNGGAEARRIFGMTHSEDGQSLATPRPYEALRALIAIQDTLGAPAKKETPVKKLTAAPAPATDLGGRNSEPGDAVLAALNRGDVAEYNRLMNAREIAARRAA